MTEQSSAALGRPTGAFVGASWVALGLGATLFFIGLWNARMLLSEKGFYFSVFLLGLFAAISVQKAVRDREEGVPVSNLFVGISWFGTGMTIVLLCVGLWNAELARSESHLRAIIETEPECIKILDARGHLVTMNAAGLAMIEADSLGQVTGQAATPGCEVGEDQHPLAGRVDGLHDLFQAGQLAGATGQPLPVVAVCRRVVADLLERCDGGEDRAFLLLAQLVGDVDQQVVEHGLVEADLLGSHRAVVQLVDLVRQLGGDLGLALRTSEQQDAVECPQRGFAVARHLCDERRPRPDQARVGEIEDCPQVGDAVLDRRAGECEAGVGGDPAQLLRGVAGRVLDRLRLVEHHRAPLQRGQLVHVANGGGIGGDHDVGLVDRTHERLVADGCSQILVLVSGDLTVLEAEPGIEALPEADASDSAVVRGASFALDPGCWPECAGAVSPAAPDAVCDAA